jgi:hypothetical protein
MWGALVNKDIAGLVWEILDCEITGNYLYSLGALAVYQISIHNQYRSWPSMHESQLRYSTL